MGSLSETRLEGKHIVDNRRRGFAHHSGAVFSSTVTFIIYSIDSCMVDVENRRVTILPRHTKESRLF